MKKILSIALAVVMVLSLASVAMAFNWSAPTSSSSDFGYQIEVIKFTSMTQAYGSASFQVDDAATAVNGAPVYFAIRLTVPDLSKDNDIRKSAKAKVEFTAISGVNGTGSDGISIANLDKGVYYYYDKTNSFEPIGFFRANLLNMNVVSETPVYAMTCLDTDTAKVYAEVTSDRPLASTFNAGDYDIVKTYAVAAGTQDNSLAANAITTSERAAAQYGTSQHARGFLVNIANVNIHQPGTVTYTIGGVSVTVDVVYGKDSNAIVADIVAKLGSEVYLDINGQKGVPFNVSTNGRNVIVFTEVSNTVVGGALQYKNLGNAFPAVSATLGDATSGVKVVEFRKAASPIGTGDLVAVLPLNSDSKVLGIITSAAEANAYDGDSTTDPIQAAYGLATDWAGSAAVIDLYEWLDDGNAGSFKDAVAAGQVYMTDSNMRAAFGFANKVSDQITWQANSTPIILDPTVSIPKTGDNASVIGFAMIMAAVVLAAVAVKKVKA